MGIIRKVHCCEIPMSFPTKHYTTTIITGSRFHLEVLPSWPPLDVQSNWEAFLLLSSVVDILILMMTPILYIVACKFLALKLKNTTWMNSTLPKGKHETTASPHVWHQGWHKVVLTHEVWRGKLTAITYYMVPETALPTVTHTWQCRLVPLKRFPSQSSMKNSMPEPNRVKMVKS